MMHPGWVIYPLTVVSAWYLSKKEIAIAAVHLLLFVILSLSNRPKRAITTAVIMAIAFTILCYITVTWYNMFKFNNTRYAIPLWLPVTWALVAYFVMDLLQTLS
jgi:hypothetical protein